MSSLGVAPPVPSITLCGCGLMVTARDSSAEASIANAVRNHQSVPAHQMWIHVGGLEAKRSFDVDVRGHVAGMAERLRGRAAHG